VGVRLVDDKNFSFSFSVNCWLNAGFTNDERLGKYCTEKVFTSGGMEAPVNEYLQEEKSTKHKV
jgi:hypothetical protein